MNERGGGVSSVKLDSVNENFGIWTLKGDERVGSAVDYEIRASDNVNFDLAVV